MIFPPIHQRLRWIRSGGSSSPGSVLHGNCGGPCHWSSACSWRCRRMCCLLRLRHCGFWSDVSLILCRAANPRSSPDSSTLPSFACSWSRSPINSDRCVGTLAPSRFGSRVSARMPLWGGFERHLPGGFPGKSYLSSAKGRCLKQIRYCPYA